MIKKLLPCVITIVLIVSILSVTMFASMYSFEQLSLTFSGGQSHSTEVKEKTDASSVYLQCTSAPYMWYASVGAGNYRFQYKYDENTYSGTYTIYAGTEVWMTNSVYERGFEGAYIIGVPSTTASYSVSGNWNPVSGQFR